MLYCHLLNITLYHISSSVVVIVVVVVVMRAPHVTNNELIHCYSLNAEVRQEAVQQALAALKNRPKPSLPMPSKRSSVLNRSPDRGDDDDSGGKRDAARLTFGMVN